MAQGTMKQKLITALRNAVFLAGLFGLCNLVCWLFVGKYAWIHYGTFFDQKEDYDVLFVGTSHVMNGVYPMELWNDYGMASYNLGTPGVQMAGNYWILENALDYANPKLVVIDVSTIGGNIKIKKAESLHKILDCFPLTITKYKMTRDLFEPDPRDKYGWKHYDRRNEFLWNFLLYHNRWAELSKEDFLPEQRVEKGGCLYTDVASYVDYKLIPKDSMMEEETLSYEYLCRMVESCQSRGIEVMLMYLPFAANKKLQMAANSAYKIAEKYNINYLNFMYEEDLLDYNIDFHDMTSENGHLNPSGARKATARLGEYICEHYEIPNRKADKSYEQWFQDAEVYRQLKVQKIGNRKNLDDCLVLLTDKETDVCIYLKEETEALQKKKMRRLFQNVALYTEAPELLEKAAKSGSEYLMVVNNGSGTLTESTDLGNAGQINASYGAIRYGKDAEGNPYLTVGEDEENYLDGTWTKEGNDKRPDVQMVVLHKETGEVEAVLNWRYTSSGAVKVKSENIVNDEIKDETDEEILDES